MTGALTDERLLWFLTRGTGVVIMVLLSLSITLGVLSTVRFSSARWPRFATQALHRNVAVIALALTVAHALAAVANGFVDLSVVDVVLPFAAADRALWSSLGTVALDLMLLAVATSLARHRFGLRGWRVVHLSTYLCWPVALAHGLGMGTDRSEPWSIAVTAVCVGLVAGAVSLRLGGRAEERRGSPPRAPVARRRASGKDRVRTS